MFNPRNCSRRWSRLLAVAAVAVSSPLLASAGESFAPDGVTIVPALTASTYLGGSSIEDATAVAVDPASGEFVVVGQTSSNNFPTRLPRQPMAGGGGDAFVARYNADATQLLWATYLGGTSADQAKGVAIGPDGTIVVTGDTSSSNFPIVGGGVQPGNRGGFEAFVAAYDRTGNLVWSTYLGGARDDYARAVAVAADGTVAVAGVTSSANFPVQSPIQAALGGGVASDAFVTVLAANGTSILFSTYLGGSTFDGATGVACEPGGRIAVAGYTDSANFPTVAAAQPVKGNLRDAFFTRINRLTPQIVASTFLGGASADQAIALALDSNGRAAVAGDTLSSDFPVLRARQPLSGGSRDGFIAVYLPDTATRDFVTYVGGTGVEQARAVAWTGAGDLLVAGFTDSDDFPVFDPLQAAGGFEDAFVASLKSDGQAWNYSTWLGAADDENASGVAASPLGAAIVVGYTSGAFPLSQPVQPLSGGSDEAFVSVLGCATPQAVGNSLRVVKLGAPLRFTWSDAVGAQSYAVLSSLDRRVTPATPFATAISGVTGVTALPPPESLVLFRVVGVNGCGNGP